LTENHVTSTSFWNGPKTPLEPGQDPNYKNNGLKVVNHFALIMSQPLSSLQF
jgi:hypothetical protein